MPTYTFLNKDTNEVEEHTLRISEYDNFLKENENLQRYFFSDDVPVLGDGMRMSVPGIGQPDARFEREVIGRIKEKVPGNTVKAGHKTKMPREW